MDRPEELVFAAFSVRNFQFLDVRCTDMFTDPSIRKTHFNRGLGYPLLSSSTSSSVTHVEIVKQECLTCVCVCVCVGNNLKRSTCSDSPESNGSTSVDSGVRCR